MKFEATLQRRRLAIPLMQSVGRRYNARKYYIKRRELLMGCVLKIQTLFRGYVTRVYICRVKAAKRIQRLLKRFRIWKFQDAVIMVMQIKIGFRTRLKTIVFIQRVIRGFNARCFVFNKRMVNFLRKRACAIIIRGYRRFVFRRSRLNFQYPTEQWVRDTCGRKLALMLWDMICDRHQRGVLAYYLQQCAPVMQRLVRGFLARRGVKALKYMRKSLRTWCQPEFANEYFRKHLENKSLVFNRQVKMIQQAALETTAVIDTGAAQGLGRNKLEYIRKFLPEEVAKKEEVDLRIALPAINAWYRSIGAPLLETESASLLRRFRNPINNYINITNMDDFISIHKKPCNMHGRTICGDCTFVRECKKPRCKCRKYVSNGHVGGACVHCVHAPFAHRICPSQLKKSLNVGGNTSAADILAEVLDRVRDPDMTIPTTLRGIDMKDAIVQPPEPIDTYHQHLKKEDELYETKLQTIAMQPRGLVRDLKDLRVDGKKMEFVDSYWDQKEINTIEAKAIGVQGSNVVVDEVVPDTTVDPTSELYFNICKYMCMV